MKRLIDFSSRFRILKGGKISLVVSALLGSTTLTFAAPSGGTVISGSANISQVGKTTNIIQNTNKVSINWKKFNIAADEVVNFKQPNVNSIALNRVIGNEKSVIDGALNANGQVWLLNSNGVLFGKNARINTAGLLATTKNLSDNDFNAGNYKFTGSSKESIINLGEIDITDSGYAALFANSVSNEGTIKAVRGSVRLVGAEEVTINFNGNSLVDLTVDKGVLDSLVENKGAIYADGGEIYLTTNAVDELLKGVVNNKGVIEANSLDNVTGHIELFAHRGTTNIDGNISAIDGFVETSGKTLSVKNSASIKAGKWLLDPTDVTIDNGTGTVGDATVGASVIENALNSGDVTIEADNDITINSDLTNSGTGNTLILTADVDNSGDGDINVNAVVTIGAGDGITLNYGANGNLITKRDDSTDSFIGKINLDAGTNGLDGSIVTINGDIYTVINDLSVLQNIGQDSTTLSGNYILGSDINASETKDWNNGEGWRQIGNNSNSFSGNFDGLGHTIDGLFIEKGTDYQGLFGITNRATIKNIGVTNADITVGKFSGILAGFTKYSNISNTFSTGSVTLTGLWTAGGLIGLLRDDSILSNSYSSASVSGNQTLGGLVGSNYSATIRNSYATGAVHGTRNVGGLVGSATNGSISNSYAIGDVIGTRNVGGLVGSATNGSISNSYATGDVTSTEDTGGGLVGLNESTITNSYATGDVTGSQNIGGLVGSNSNGTITNSYYDNESNLGEMDDSATYGKTRDEIKIAFRSLSDWFVGGGNHVEGYSTSTATVTLPALLAFYTGSNNILFNSGYGTEANPYTITNWTQLQNINNENILTENYYFSLLNNLTTSSTGYTSEVANGQTLANNGEGWHSIGISDNYRFTGIFDGGNYTIDSLNNSLFGYINSNSSVSNLGLTNVNILKENYDSAYSLAYGNSGTINNVYAKGNVTGQGAAVAGLVLHNRDSGQINNSYFEGNIKAQMTIGGLTALNEGIIDNSYTKGEISGQDTIGGLVGIMSGGSISNSYSEAKVKGESHLGGILGYVQTSPSSSNDYTYDSNYKDVNITDTYYYERINPTNMGDTLLAKKEVVNTPTQDNNINKIITTIVNKNAVNIPTPPQVVKAPVNAPVAPTARFAMQDNKVVVSKPMSGQATKRVTLSEARQMQQNTPGQNSGDVITTLTEGSNTLIYNGGVNLGGMDQVLFIQDEI